MKPLYETIFDTTATPEDFVVWKRNLQSHACFDGESSEVNPIFQQLLDPIVSRSNEVYADTAKHALVKQKQPVLVVLYTGEPAKIVQVYNMERGKLVYYSFRQSSDTRYVSSVGRFKTRLEYSIFDRLPDDLNSYYLISEKDVKIIEDFYGNIQKRVK